MCVVYFSSKASCNVWNFPPCLFQAGNGEDNSSRGHVPWAFYSGKVELLPPFPANIDEGLVSLKGLLTIMIPSKSPYLRPAMYFAGFGRWQLEWVGPLDSHDERS